MEKKAPKKSVKLQYVGYLRQALPLVASSSRYPKLVQYEHQVAKLVERERNIESSKNKKSEDDTKRYHYTARDVHTPVWRAMQYLVTIGEAVKIGRCYYPASENGMALYQSLCDNILLTSPDLHVISRTAYAITISPGQERCKIKETLVLCLGEENLFGSLIQDDIVVVLLSPNAPTELIAEFSSWIKDAYESQKTLQKSQKKKT